MQGRAAADDGVQGPRRVGSSTLLKSDGWGVAVIKLTPSGDPGVPREPSGIAGKPRTIPTLKIDIPKATLAAKPEEAAPLLLRTNLTHDNVLYLPEVFGRSTRFPPQTSGVGGTFRFGG